MIKNLASASPFLTVSSNYPPNIYNNGMLNVGSMRYNPTIQSVEVFDGNMWQLLSQSVSVGLSWEAESAIRWAHEKMAEENTLKEKMKNCQMLKTAYEQFKIVEALVALETNNESV